MSEAAEAVALRYFEAIAGHDLDAALACWRPGGLDRLLPIADLEAPAGIRSYFEGIFASMPDFRYEVLETVAGGDTVAVRWRVSGTLTGAPYLGIRANGRAVELEGIDLVHVSDGLIVRNDSYWDDSAVARQLGLLPPRGSSRERVLIGLFNVKTALVRLVRR